MLRKTEKNAQETRHEPCVVAMMTVVGKPGVIGGNRESELQLVPPRKTRLCSLANLGCPVWWNFAAGISGRARLRRGSWFVAPLPAFHVWRNNAKWEKWIHALPDERRIKVIANSPPRWNGTQAAVDTTLVAPLTKGSDESARRSLMTGRLPSTFPVPARTRPRRLAAKARALPLQRGRGGGADSMT